MRTQGLAVTTVLAAAAIWASVVPARSAADEKEAPAKLADLAWLEGNWRHADGGEIFDELWTAPEGDAMAAVSRSVRDGKTSMYELSSIEASEKGLVLCIRHFGAGLASWKSEAAATPAWPLVRRGDREAVFEDATRAFPRSIVYRRESGTDGAQDVLVARLEGERGGKPTVMEFRLTRTSPK